MMNVKSTPESTSLVKRYLLFVVGVGCNALGIALITKSALGIPPVSSIAYIATLLSPMSLGMTSLILNILFFLGQILLLRDKFDKIQYLQIPTAVLFSVFIDLAMLLLTWVQPEHYLSRLIALFMGCVILALGISMEVTADVLMIPGEGIVKALALSFNKDFSFIKLIFDVTMVTSTVLVSFLCLGGLYGIREGTVIAALCIGPITRFIRKGISRMGTAAYMEA